MFDHEAVTIARQFIEAELTMRDVRFHDEIARVKSEAALKGHAASGALLKMVADVCGNEVEARGDRLWRAIPRAIVATGAEFSANLAAELKKDFDEIFQRYCSATIEAEFQKTRETLSIDAVVAGHTGFYSRVIGARQSAYAEIDLFARSLERRAKFERGASQAVYNFYSPVGAVQTGPGASASVVQNLEGAARQELAEALGRIADQLSDTIGLDAARSAELRDAVKEAQEELQKVRPTGTMLMAKLQGAASLISAAVQVAPALRSGYDAVRAILVAHGISLP